MEARTVFNPAQQYLLNVMADVKDDTTLNDIRSLISRYFAAKALDAIDKMWDEGSLSQETMDVWVNEHLRKH